MILSNKAILPLLWELFPDHNGRCPLIGSWIIGQQPAGIGVREADNG